MRIRNHVGDVDIQFSSERITRNLKEAQKLLNMKVVADCDPLIPFQQGALKDSVNYPQGIYGGEIEYDTPYAHAVYEGYIFSPNIPITDSAGNVVGWFSPSGKKKQKTDRKMQFHAPGTTDHFFEKSKARHKYEWLNLVRRKAGRG